MMIEPGLSVRIGSLNMRTPVTTGAGTFGSGVEMEGVVDLTRIGALTVTAVTARPRLGNPPVRMVETASGLLNAVGLPNGGVDSYLEETAPRLRRLDVPVIVNVAGESPEDFAYVVRRLSEVGAADAVELNLSCPEVAQGLDFGTDPKRAGEVVAACRRVTALPLIAKLAAGVADVRPIAKAAEEAGADAVSLINVVVGTSIDARARRFRLAARRGGLSGPAIKPIALYHVCRAAEVVAVPIIGMGGIASATDAVEFLLAGASAVAVGTINFVNPNAAAEVAQGIAEYLAENGFTDVRDIVGTVSG